MPELPEVETIAANLRLGRAGYPAMIGRVFQGVQLLWPRSLEQPAPQEMPGRIAGQKIVNIHRRGKYLIFSLSRDTLLIHLRMSGDLTVESSNAPIASHCRILFDIGQGERLVFNDARKFGRVWLLADPALVLSSLGPEPLDETFTPVLFYEMLLSRHRQLKPLLLDQSFIAGLGNIYTDESLHLAHIHPLKLSDSLNRLQVKTLLHSIRSVLQDGIHHNGASLDWVYRGGDFQNYFRVYQRTGESCPECGTIIQRLVVGQRGTHICPKCQPAPTTQGEAR